MSRAGAVTTTFDAPVNRVLAAAFEAAAPDFLFDLDKGSRFNFPIKSVTSARGRKALNDGVVPGKRTFEADVPLEELDLGSGNIVGRMKDGRAVTLWLLERNSGKTTEAFVRIGKNQEAGSSGDDDLCVAYLDRIRDKLAHPIPRTEGDSGIVFSVDEAIARSLKKPAEPVDQRGLAR